MSEETKDTAEEPGAERELSPKERFEKTSHIALLMCYDLIDKLRYWEKETVSLPEEQINERLEHLAVTVEQLRTAYLNFSELEL